MRPAAHRLLSKKALIFSNRYGILPSAWRRIEVVITGLTRNQLNSDVPWVRIPPSPPKTKPPNGGFCFWLLETVGIRTGSVVNEAPVALQSRAHGPPRTAGRIPPRRTHKYCGGGWLLFLAFGDGWDSKPRQEKATVWLFQRQGQNPTPACTQHPSVLALPLDFFPRPRYTCPNN